MIVAAPEQYTVRSSGIGIPEHTSVLTWYRWWCSACRISAVNVKCSHAVGALQQAEHHLRTEQCHVVGQLELFTAGGGL